ncbi:MAG: 50S ribosomal protein L25 [bacterium]|nr:50S ribosomal protein L25 [bacterium]
MEQIPLPIFNRSEGDRASHIRQSQHIPAVVYGNGFTNLHLKVEYQTFRKVFEKATYSTIVALDIEGGEKIPVLIHEVQYDPVSDRIIHIDFRAIRMDEKVETTIVLEFVGASEAVRLGAELNINKHEVHVSCLPGDLVHSIPVDISVLAQTNDDIRISGITVPQGIQILDPEEELVVSAIEPRDTQVEEEKEAVASAAAAEAAAAAAAAEAAAAQAEEGAPAAGEEKKEKKEKEKKE